MRQNYLRCHSWLLLRLRQPEPKCKPSCSVLPDKDLPLCRELTWTSHSPSLLILALDLLITHRKAPGGGWGVSPMFPQYNTKGSFSTTQSRRLQLNSLSILLLPVTVTEMISSPLALALLGLGPCSEGMKAETSNDRNAPGLRSL